MTRGRIQVKTRHAEQKTWLVRFVYNSFFSHMEDTPHALEAWLFTQAEFEEIQSALERHNGRSLTITFEAEEPVKNGLHKLADTGYDPYIPDSRGD